MKLVSIPTEQSAFDLLRSILDDKIDSSEIEIDFSSAVWAKFSLKIEGERYHSTLNADLMRALVEYQTTLYRIAAYARNGKMRGSALDENARENLKLNFHVAEGSSDIWAEAFKAIAEFAGKVTEGMGPKAKLTIALVTVLSIFGGTPVHEWVTQHYDIQKEQIKSEDHQHELQVLDHAVAALSDANKSAVSENEKIMESASQSLKEAQDIRREARNATNLIIRQVRDADNITFQGYSMPGRTVRLLDGTKRRSGEDVRITRKFKVESATSTQGEGFICKVRSDDGTVIQATIMDAIMADKDKEIIQEAFWKKTEVTLTISARKIGVEYKNAEIEHAIK